MCSNAGVGKARDRRGAGEGAPRQDQETGGGQLFFEKKAEVRGREVRRDMVEPDHPDLSITRRCKLLSISRPSFHYAAKGESAQNLALMRLIDEQFLETPFFGVRCRSSRKPLPAGRRRGTRPIPICWVGCGSIGPIRSGAPTSPICRCGAGFSSHLEL